MNCVILKKKEGDLHSFFGRPKFSQAFCMQDVAEVELALTTVMIATGSSLAIAHSKVYFHPKWGSIDQVFSSY